MDRQAWEERKVRNQALERRARRITGLKDEHNKPGMLVRTHSGAIYKIAEDGSWRRIEGG
jgi:hypothetical protein